MVDIISLAIVFWFWYQFCLDQKYLRSAIYKVPTDTRKLQNLEK